MPRRPAPQARSSSSFDGRSFSFLNRRITWEGPSRWNPPAADALWIFNLHYFRYLAQAPGDSARHLILDWIASHAEATGAAWHPYPISLRVREWIEWLHTQPADERTPRVAVTRSLVAQVEALRRRLEFNLMGNHLLENAITLCWAGLSFSGSRADEWLAEGAPLLDCELRAQVRGDGSHEERSPMYQALLAEAVLRLSEVAEQSAKPSAPTLVAVTRDTGRRMLRALARMVHPDGGYALLNDTAFGVAPTLESLLDRFQWQAARHDRRMWSLPDAGLSGFRSDGDYLIFDAGPIGPSHQPGHGHAGALSFEMSARGRRLVTDTGVFTYTPGRVRRYDRGTAAHNTIEIDGRDQSDIWGAFRCGRRAAPRLTHVDDGREGTTLAGSYRGPGQAGPRSVAHERRVFANGRLLAFTDNVSAPGDHSATLRVHLAPGLRVRPSGRTCDVNDERGHQVALLAAEGLTWTATSSPYHPEFGVEIERVCVSALLRFRDAAVAKWWLLLN